MECFVSIELGTNAVRVYAFNVNGETIAYGKGTYPTFHPDPDYSEQDPQQIFITMLYVLKNVLSEKLHPKKYKVHSICFSASMHSVLAIDKNGLPLGNVITWADNRGKKEARTLRNSPLSEKVYKATGTPIHPMSPLIKIRWLKNQDKERFEKTYKFLSVKTYIIQQITGAYVIDYSLASATGLMNIYNKKWESEALDYACIKAEKLPELVPISFAEVKLKPQYQVSLGLSADTKILAGSSDGCFATLGASVWNDKTATITIEDSAAVRVVGKRVLQDEKQRLFNYVLDEENYVSGGPSNNGGVAFEWFSKQFGDFKAPYDVETCMEELMEDATRVAPGAGGLLFLPYLLGERAPIWNPNARGVFFGININHERKHFVRATIEGILFGMYSIGKMLEEHRDITSISVNGSFATLPFCAQILADVFNRPLSVSQNANSVSYGAFLLSATESGIYKSLDEAAKSIVLPDTYHPNENNHAVYMKRFPLFEKLSVKLSDEFEEWAMLEEEAAT